MIELYIVCPKTVRQLISSDNDRTLNCQSQDSQTTDFSSVNDRILYCLSQDSQTTD